MYSNIKVYQKYLVTSIKVGCATRSLYASSGPKAEGVPTNNQRGRGSGPKYTSKQNRECSEGYSKCIDRKNNKFGKKIGINK